MNRHVVAIQSIIHETGAFHEYAQIVQRDSPVDLGEGAIDYVLQLGRVQQAGAAHSDEVAPSVGRETPPLVRAEDAKCHRLIESPGTWPDKAATNVNRSAARTATEASQDGSIRRGQRTPIRTAPGLERWIVLIKAIAPGNRVQDALPMI